MVQICREQMLELFTLFSRDSLFFSHEASPSLSPRRGGASLSLPPFASLSLSSQFSLFAVCFSLARFTFTFIVPLSFCGGASPSSPLPTPPFSVSPLRDSFFSPRRSFHHTRLSLAQNLLNSLCMLVVCV
ncbi:hypothetical protein MTR_8g105755 [Medicago truncatula]|uniref:Uncharacterized protein n=1 Tax=Medicago truncatula TaxID=3880 RepID=A0A072TX25_MEDTR|nr:hypothetical protein MTR_8g105755 [Medicago truncatula]